MNYLKDRLKPGQTQLAAEAIPTLCNRLEHALLALDRRLAILALKSFARRYRETVVEHAMRPLAKAFIRYAEDDPEVARLVLETFLVLFIRGESDEDMTRSGWVSQQLRQLNGKYPSPLLQENHVGSDQLSMWIADELTRDLEVVATMMAVTVSQSFHTKLYALQLMEALVATRAKKAQEVLLLVPTAISSLVALLDDSYEPVRNEAILLLMALAHHNLSIQKLVAFENCFERVFDIIAEEGGIRGLVLVQDCLTLLTNLLQYNALNQQLFLETANVPRLQLLLAEAVPSPENDPIVWTPQRIQNMTIALEMGRLFVDEDSEFLAQNQGKLFEGGVLYTVLQLVFAPFDTPNELKAAALEVTGSLIAGNPSIQDEFYRIDVPYIGDPSLPVLKAETLTAAVPLMLMHWALTINLVHCFGLRMQAAWALRCFFKDNLAIKVGFLKEQAAAYHDPSYWDGPEGEDSPELSNLFSTVMDYDAQAKLNPYRPWFALVIMMYTFEECPEARDFARSVQNGVETVVEDNDLNDEKPDHDSRNDNDASSNENSKTPADSQIADEAAHDNGTKTDTAQDLDSGDQVVLTEASPSVNASEIVPTSLSFDSEVMSCIPALAELAVASLESGYDERVPMGFFMLLTYWMYEDFNAVNDFLSAGVLRLILAFLSGYHAELEPAILLKSMASLALGVAYEFSTASSPVPRKEVHSILCKSMGKDNYSLRVKQLRDSPQFRNFDDYVPTDQPGLPEVYFNLLYVGLVKSHMARIRRALFHDPNMEPRGQITFEAFEELEWEVQSTKEKLLEEKTRSRDAESTNARLERDLKEAQSKLSAIQASLGEINSKYDATVAALEALEKARQGFESQAAQYHSQLQDATKSATQSQTRTKQLELKLSEVKAAKSKLEDGINKMVKDLFALKKEKEALEKQVKLLTKEVQLLRKTMSKGGLILATDLGAKLAEAEARAELASARATQAEAQVAELEAELLLALDYVLELESSNEHLVEKLRAAGELLKDLKAEKKEAEAALEEVKARGSSQKSVARNLDGMATTLDPSAQPTADSSLSTELARVKLELEEALEFQMSLADELDEVKDRSEKLTEEVVQLKAQLTKIHSEKEGLAKEKMSLSLDNEDLAMENEELREAKETLYHEKQEIAKAKEALVEELAVAQGSSSHLELLANHTSKVEQLGSAHALELSELREKHGQEVKDLNDSHSNEIDSLKDGHKHAMDELDRKNKACLDELNAENQRKIEELEKAHLELAKQKQLEYAADVEELKRGYEAKMEHLRTDSESKAANARVTHAAALAKAQEEFSAKSDEVAKTHLAAIEELKADHLQHVNDLKQQYDLEKVAAGDENQLKLLEEHERVLESLKANHSKEFEAVDTKYTEELDELKEKHSKEVKDLENNHDSLVASLRESHLCDVDTLKRDHSWELAILKESHEKELEALREDSQTKMAQLEKSHTEALEQVEALTKENEYLRSSQDALTQLEESFARKRTQLEEDFHQKLSELKEEHSCKVAQSDKAHSESLAKLEDGYKDQLGKLQATIDLLREDSSSSKKTTEELDVAKKLQNLESEYADLLSKQEVTRELLESHELELESLQHEKKQEMAEMEERLRDEIKAIEAEAERARVELELLRATSEEIDKLTKDRHEEAMALVKADFEKELERLKVAQSNQIDSLKATHEKELEGVSSEQLEHVREAHDESLADLKAQHGEELDKANKEHAGELQQVRVSLGQELEKVREELLLEKQAHEETRATHGPAISDLQLKHAQTLATLEDKHKSEMEELGRKHEALVLVLREEYRNELDKAKSDYEKALSKTCDAHRSEIADLKQEHDEAKHALESQVGELRALHDELGNTHEVSLRDLKHQHEASQKDLEKKLEAAQSDYAQKIEENRKEHMILLEGSLTQVSELQMEIDSLKADVKSKVDESQQLQNSLEKLQHEKGIVNEKVEALQTEKEQLLAELSDARDLLKSFEAQIADSESKMDRIRTQTKSLALENEVLTKQINELTQESLERGEQLEAARAQVAALEQQISEAQKTLEALTAQVTQVVSSLKAKEDEYDQVLSELSQAKETLGLVTQERDEATTRWSELKIVIGELQLEVIELKRRVDVAEKAAKEANNHKRRADEAEVASQKAQRELEAAKNLLVEFETGKEEAREEFVVEKKRLNDQVAELESQLAQVKFEKLDVERRLNELEQELEASRGSALNADDRHANIEAQWEKLQIDHHKLQNQYEEMSSAHFELDEAHKKLSEAHLELTEVHEKLGKDQEALQGLFMGLQESSTDHKELQLAHTTLQEDHAKVKEAYAEAEKNLVEAAKVHAHLQELVRTNEKLLHQLRAEHEQLQQQLKFLASEVEEKQNEILRLQESQGEESRVENALKARVLELEKKLKEAEDSTDAERHLEEKEKLLQDLQAKHLAVEETLSKVEMDQGVAEKRYKVLEDRHTELERTHENLRMELLELLGAHSELETKHEELKEKHGHLLEAHDKHQSDDSILARKLGDYEQKLTSIESDLHALRVERDSLASERDVLVKTNDELLQELEEVTKQQRALATEFDALKQELGMGLAEMEAELATTKVSLEGASSRIKELEAQLNANSNEEQIAELRQSLALVTRKLELATKGAIMLKEKLTKVEEDMSVVVNERDFLKKQVGANESDAMAQLREQVESLMIENSILKRDTVPRQEYEDTMLMIEELDDRKMKYKNRLLALGESVSDDDGDLC